MIMEKNVHIDSSQNISAQDLAAHQRSFGTKFQSGVQTNPIQKKMVEFVHLKSKFSIKDNYFK